MCRVSNVALSYIQCSFFHTNDIYSCRLYMYYMYYTFYYLYRIYTNALLFLTLQLSLDYMYCQMYEVISYQGGNIN